MRRNNSILLLTLLATLLANERAGAAVAPNGTLPKVVVNILVDQLRSDYLEAFMPLYGEEGLKRLMSEGRVHVGAEYPMMQVDRASAAATISTGTTPSNHGIVGQRWVDREQHRTIYCIADEALKKAGAGQPYSASLLTTTTISDELKVATEGKAIVISLAPDADAAIMQAGHAADHAFWLDDATGRWVSSPYYGTTIPSWISSRNHQLAAAGGSITWEPTSEFVGNFSYFLSGGMKDPFKHVMKGAERFRQWKTSGLVNKEIALATEALLQVSQVGNDKITDYLSLMLYAGGFEGATATECPLEIQDTYVRLDDAVERILRALDKKVGRDNVLLTLTSTGYTSESNADLSRYRIPTGTFDMKRATGLLAMYLRAVYSQGDLITTTHDNQIFLNHKAIEDHQINYSELLVRCQDFMQQLAGVRDVYGSVRILQGGQNPGIAKIRNGYSVQRSGDLLIEVMPSWRCTNADSGYDRLSRASYVPFPIIFYGAGIRAEKITDATTVDYIAPTLSSAMRIRAPNGCDKSPLF